MSLIRQKVAHLLSGISQRPQTQRLPTQATEQLNGLSSLARGVMKRPPTQYLGQLTADPTGWDNAFVHTIDRDSDERYRVVVADGEIFVYDVLTQASVPVETPGGTTYLEDPTGAGFRAVTVGDTTFIVNRGVETAKDIRKAPEARNEALVYVRQADFSTQYNITVDGVLVSLRTVDMDTPASRRGISTEAIATDLLTALQAAGLGGFAITRNGSTIHIFRTDGEDFSLSVSDGLSDNGLKAVKGETQMFEDLPARSVHGFVAEISGSIDTAKDNYFVQYDDLGEPGKPGVWRECPKPGTLIGLDASTLPHRLALRGDVGVENKKHEGLPPSVGTVRAFVPAPTELPWTEYLLPYSTRRTREHTGGARVTLAAGSRRFVVPHVLTDIRNLELFMYVDVVLLKNGVVVDSKRYTNAVQANPLPADGDIFQGSLTADNVLTGDIMEVQLRYEGDLTPPANYLVTLYIFDGRLYSDVGVEVIIGTGDQSPGNLSSTFFALGSVITLTLDGTPFTFTVATVADQSLAAVRIALSDLVALSPTYSILSFVPPDRFTVIRADGAVPVGSFVGQYPALTFLNAGMALTPDDLVGRVLRNLTDGSSGPVTGNTVNTITVGSLTGGADNTFQTGDLISIFVDPSIGTHFVFSSVPWKDRIAGNTDVVTFPSFIGSTISDVFFYQNRVGFLCKENIVFTSSGDLFNLFRYTATDLRSDDSIDIRSAHAEVTIFDSAFLWSGGLYVKSDNVWFRVSGEPALTPTTIRLDPVGRYPSSHDPRPVVVGERAYFTRAKGGTTQLFEIQLADDGNTSKAVDITKDIPTYIQGSPVALVGDGAEGFLALLTTTESQRILYVFSWLDRGNTRIFESWSKWDFPAGTRIIGLDLVDGVLGFVRKHADGVFVEQLDLDLPEGAEEKVAYLDRRLSSPSASFGGAATTWTLPYAVATDGSEGDVVVTNRATGAVYATTRPSATSVAVAGAGDLSGASVYVGQPYLFRYVPSTLYIRGQDGLPETSGRLQIRYLNLFYKDTTDFTLTVAPWGRTPISYVVNAPTPDADTLHVPVLCRNIDVTLAIENETPGACALSEIDWEGFYTNRGKRV